MRNALKLGKLGGIEFGIDYSWFIVFALVTWSLAVGYFPAHYGWPAETCWAIGALTSLLFFGCVVAHELGHSVVAIHDGIPVHSITLFIFGGIARITREPDRPLDELLIAIAGPAVSLVLGLVFLALALISPSPQTPLPALAFWLGGINLTLAIFNLIPGFPLDGGRVLRAVVWRVTGSFQRATRIATTVGQVVAYGFIFVAIWLFFSGQWISGLWLGFIGWFLENAAVSTYRQVAMQQHLSGLTARAVMITDFPRVPRSTSVQTLVDDYLLSGTTRCVPVSEDGRVFGIVTLHDVRHIPREQWPYTTVDQAMTPFERTTRVAPDRDLYDVVKLMAEDDVNQVPVTEDGQLLGMISRDRLVSYLAARSELGM